MKKLFKCNKIPDGRAQKLVSKTEIGTSLHKCRIDDTKDNLLSYLAVKPGPWSLSEIEVHSYKMNKRCV